MGIDFFEKTKNMLPARSLSYFGSLADKDRV
jgi:hypothetical protein